MHKERKCLHLALYRSSSTSYSNKEPIYKNWESIRGREMKRVKKRQDWSWVGERKRQWRRALRCRKTDKRGGRNVKLFTWVSLLLQPRRERNKILDLGEKGMSENYATLLICSLSEINKSRGRKDQRERKIIGRKDPTVWDCAT